MGQREALSRHSHPHSPARAERSEAARMRIRKARSYCNLQRMRVQGEGRLCEKPFSLACSFFTVFLHEQKDGAPQGASCVLNKSVRIRRRWRFSARQKRGRRAKGPSPERIVCAALRKAP